MLKGLEQNDDKTKLISDEEKSSAQITIRDADAEADLYELQNDLQELRECIRLLKKTERNKNIRNATFKFAICSVIVMDIIAYSQAEKSGKSANNKKDAYNLAVIMDNGNQTTCAEQAPLLSCSDITVFAAICAQLMADYCSMHHIQIEWTIATSFIFLALFVFCCAPLLNETCRKNLFRGFNQSSFQNIYMECSEDDYELITAVTVRNEIETDRRSKSEVLRDLNKKLYSLTAFISFSTDERKSFYSFFTRNIPLRALTRRNNNQVYTYVSTMTEDDLPAEKVQLQLTAPELELKEEKVQEDDYEVPQEDYDFEEESGVEMTTLGFKGFTSSFK